MKKVIKNAIYLFTAIYLGAFSVFGENTKKNIIETEDVKISYRTITDQNEVLKYYEDFLKEVTDKRQRAGVLNTIIEMLKSVENYERITSILEEELYEKDGAPSLYCDLIDSYTRTNVSYKKILKTVKKAEKALEEDEIFNEREKKNISWLMYANASTSTFLNKKKKETLELCDKAIENMSEEMKNHPRIKGWLIYLRWAEMIIELKKQSRYEEARETLTAIYNEGKEEIALVSQLGILSSYLKDYEQAEKYFTIGALRGDNNCKNNLKFLQKRLEKEKK